MRPENPIGVPFTVLGEVDSTNNYAMRQVQAHLAGHGAAWFADFQNAGKGQRGKPWKAESRQNIMMSVLLEPDFLPIENQFFLTVAVALACFDFFNAYAIDNTSIKWPNDLYWRDRKAAGVLIENVIKGKNWRYAIVGIGININQTLFPDNLPNPVSLKQVTGRTFDVHVLGRELCSYLELRWQQLRSGELNELLAEYNSILYKRGQQVKFKKETAIFDAVVTGANEHGELTITTGNNIVSTLPHGSVEWMLG